MSKFIGQLVNVGLAKEAVRGTPVAATYWLPKTALSFDDRVEKVIASESLGVIDDSSDAYVVQKFGEGGMEGYIRDKSFGLLLYALLGTVSSAVKETTAYNHTFTIAQSNQHQSLTVSVDDPIGDVLFPLTMINKLSIDVKLGEIVKFNVDFMSRQSRDSSFSTSYVAENKFTAKHAIIKIAANIAGLAAASALAIKGFKIDFVKNLMKEQDLGTPSLADIHNQAMSVEGEIDLLYEDRTYRDYMLNETYKSLRLDIINGDVTIGASSNPELQINLPRVHFFDWEVDRANEKLSSQKMKFKGLYDLTNAKNIIDTIVLTNTVTSY